MAGAMTKVSVRNIAAHKLRLALTVLAVVLGTEGDGLAESTIAACDCTVRIPMTHGVDSLNVAAASAVAFYQLALLAGLSETED